MTIVLFCSFAATAEEPHKEDQGLLHEVPYSPSPQVEVR